MKNPPYANSYTDEGPMLFYAGFAGVVIKKQLRAWIGKSVTWKSV